MQTYIVERDIPGAGSMTVAELQNVSKTASQAIREYKLRMKWLESFVTTDKVYCLIMADNEEVIRHHANLCGFNVNQIETITTKLDPAVE